MTKLVERLEKPSTAYGMEISAEKTKLMTNDNKEMDTSFKLSRTSGTCAQLRVC